MDRSVQKGRDDHMCDKCRENESKLFSKINGLIEMSDAITKMSDEELAQFLSGIFGGDLEKYLQLVAAGTARAVEIVNTMPPAAGCRALGFFYVVGYCFRALEEKAAELKASQLHAAAVGGMN